MPLKYTPEERIEAFWAKVDKDGPIPPHRPELGPCWQWQGPRFPKGYGHCSISKSMQLAHRAAWIFAYDSIPSGMHVLHHCDNPPCVNPAHLFLGTNADNMADRNAKGRTFAGPRPWLRSRPNLSRAKLDASQVLEIRAMRSAGIRQREIAAKFGVGVKNIEHITRRATWKFI